MENRYEKFSALNTYRKITGTLGNTIALIAFIPLFIGIYLAFTNLWGILDFSNFPLVPCLTCLGISFSLFYVAGSLFIISELIQCFLAIEENTYQTAQNTSSLHQEVTDEP